jgi:hypothetical protein
MEVYSWTGILSYTCSVLALVRKAGIEMYGEFKGQEDRFVRLRQAQVKPLQQQLQVRMHMDIFRQGMSRAEPIDVGYRLKDIELRLQGIIRELKIHEADAIDGK